VTAPYDHEALWLKAKLFLNRAMDDDALRTFDEQALWASLALELLGKSALARISPGLIAEPTEDGVNILVAFGLVEGEAPFSSVRASTIFKRCHRAFRPFNANQAQAVAGSRNEYLHGAGVGFASLPQNVFWQRFWAQAAILVTAQDRALEELVGSSRVGTVEAHLEANKKHFEHRTEALIERARQRLKQHQAGMLPAKVQAEWQITPDLSAVFAHRATAECPACGSAGLLEGEDPENVRYEAESYGAEHEDVVRWAELTVPALCFSCSTCHLVLDGYELISQTNLPATFEVIDDDPYPEPEYGND
jgi:hypothetical protein